MQPKNQVHHPFNFFNHSLIESSFNSESSRPCGKCHVSHVTCPMSGVRCQEFSKDRPSGPMLSTSQNVRVCVRVCVCLFTFEVPFNGLFAPTSQSWKSNIFRDSECLGKSNGKKWSQI